MHRTALLIISIILSREAKITSNYVTSNGNITQTDSSESQDILGPDDIQITAANETEKDKEIEILNRAYSLLIQSSSPSVTSSKESLEIEFVTKADERNSTADVALLTPTTPSEFSIANCSLRSYTNPDEVLVNCENVIIEDISPLLPSRITHLYFKKCRNARTLSSPVLSHLSELRLLSVHWSQVKFVTSRFLTGLRKLKELILSSNYIMVLHPKLFDHTPCIEKLSLVGNIISNVESIANAIASLKRLKKLSLADNKALRRILSKHFLALQNSSLEELILTNCALSNVEEGAFRPLKNMRKLYLSVNEMGRRSLLNITSDLPYTSIEELELRGMTSVFTGGPFITKELYPLKDTNISSLDLDSNYMAKLDELAFPPIHSLKKLTLRNCFLGYIEEGALKNLVNLEELYLNNNRLTSVPRYLPNLKFLDMSSNPRGSTVQTEFVLPDQCFAESTHLRQFVLHESYFPGPITPNTFAGLVNLDRLEISLTLLRNISDYAFKDLINLKRLFLSSNLLSFISSNTFVGLGNLTQLYLHNNLISHIPDKDTFKPLVSMEVLIFRNNRLKTFHPNMFASNIKLELAYFSNNQITSWNYQVFPENGSLRVLFLDSNAIDDVTAHMLKTFKKLETIKLSDNSFRCDTCGMKRFQEWLLQEVSNTTIEGANNYACIHSPHRNESLLQATIPEELCWPEVNHLTQILTISLISTALMIFSISISAYRLRWYLRYLVFSARSRVRKYKHSYVSRHYDYDAFVSYSAQDATWVCDQLVPNLEEEMAKYRLCLHERDFMVGVPITDNILEAVDKSRKTIMVLTEDYVRSTWCMFELHMAQHRLFEDTRDALVLVLLKEIGKDKMPKHLKYLMRTRTYIPWFGCEGRVASKLFWKRLVDALRGPAEIQVLSRVI